MKQRIGNTHIEKRFVYLSTTAITGSVGYLLGGNEDADILKEPKMPERLKTINAFSEQEKQQVYFTLDAYT